jgi:hypothetical protein
LVDEGPNEKVLNGGILIWHIDETVIRKQINTVGVNSNPDRKGVELKEADGAQDIGRPMNIGFSQNAPIGSAFDFWWSGNNSSVIFQTDTLSLYQNRFGPDTFPNNQSHTGAISPFEIYDISENLPIASFKIDKTIPDNTIFDLITSSTLDSVTTSTLLSDAYWSRYPLAIQSVPSNDSSNRVIIPGMDGFILYNPDTKISFSKISDDESLQQPLTDFNRSGLLAIAPNPLHVVDNMDVSLYSLNNDIATLIENYPVVPNSGFLSSSEAAIIDIDGTRFRINTDSGSIIQSPVNQQLSENIGQIQSVIENNQLKIYSAHGTVIHPLIPSDSFTREHTGLIHSGNGLTYVYLLLDDKLSLYSPTDQYSNEIVLADGVRLGWPAIIDLHHDGNPDFLYVNQVDGKLYGKNSNGGMIDGFPITAPPGNQFTGTPLVADLDGDGSTDILIPAEDTFSLSIFAYKSDTEIIDHFPLMVGGIPSSNHQLIHPILMDRYLIAVSQENDLKVWEFPKIEKIQWGSLYGNSSNNKVTAQFELSESPTVSYTLLNSSETYNWPNPATDETFIRFQTESAAQIRIRITTLSGRLISDKRFNSLGGPPEDLHIDTSSWVSGAYIALLEATSGNTTEKKLIKIAIVR